VKKAIFTLFVAIASLGVFAQDGEQASKTNLTKSYLTVEVAANNFTGRVEGDEFILQGYIYPEGTLNETNGINADGSAEFPELLLGTWTCSGWFEIVRDETVTPVGARTVQTFEFDMTNVGENMLVTFGYEQFRGTDVFVRVVTGTSGVYGNNAGVQTQSVLGANASGGRNYHSVFSEDIAYNFKDK